jgi:hypothetical protein
MTSAPASSSDFVIAQATLLRLATPITRKRLFSKFRKLIFTNLQVKFRNREGSLKVIQHQWFHHGELAQLSSFRQYDEENDDSLSREKL